MSSKKENLDKKTILALEKEIASAIPFLHDAKETTDAIGVDLEVIKASHMALIEDKSTSFSKMVEFAETILTKRETTFLMLSAQIQMAKLIDELEQIKKKVGKKRE